MARSQESDWQLIDEILALLNRSPLLSNCHVWQRDEAPSGAFVLKVRCRARARFTFQVWISQSARGIRYSYQLTLNGDAVRWDNAPHFPNLKNYPHHWHDAQGNHHTSRLLGDPLRDLPIVLQEVKEYLET